MVDIKRILNLAVHLVPLAVFWDLIRSVVLLLISPHTLHLNIRIIATVAGGMAALLTVVIGSPLLYSITIVILVLSTLTESTVSLPWASLIGLPIMLVLDNILTSFSVVEGRNIYIKGVDILKSFTIVVGLMIPFMVFFYYIGYYFLNLINLFSASLIHRINWIEAQYIIRAILIVVSIAITISFVRGMGSVIIPFILPSRKISLVFLKDLAELNVVFKPYFTHTILVLSSLAFYPVLWGILFNIILTAPMARLRGLLQQSPFIDMVFGVAIFLLTMHILSNVIRLEMPFRLTKKRAIYAIAILLLVYIATVKLAVDNGTPLTTAVIAPNFNSLASVLVASYIDYAYYMLSFIELLSRLLGVAP